MSARRQTVWSYLGRLSYDRGLELQERAADRLKAGTGPERLYLLEHEPVYTVGRNATEEDIRASDDWLARTGVEIRTTDRGGQVTYHGPGQLVGYPILDLNPDRRDVRRYVQDLERVLVRTLSRWGIEAEPRPSPHIGVWVGDAKIASLGIHLSRWVTTHGFALNVSTDLGHFGGIVACGLPDVKMVSIESLTGERPELETVADVVVEEMARVFDRDLVAASS